MWLIRPVPKIVKVNKWQIYKFELIFKQIKTLTEKQIEIEKNIFSVSIDEIIYHTYMLTYKVFFIILFFM